MKKPDRKEVFTDSIRDALNTALFDLLNTSTRFIDGSVSMEALAQALAGAQSAGATPAHFFAITQTIKEAIGWDERGQPLPVPRFHPPDERSH